MIGAHQSNPVDWNPHKLLGNLVRPCKTETGEKALRTVYLYRERTSPNRCYVGQTGDKKERKRTHNKAIDKVSKFHSRIRELRKDAGTKIPVHEIFDYSEIVQRSMTQSEADFYERALILHFNAFYPHGFSKRWSGGCSEETKRKISKKNKGKICPWKGKKLSEKHKQAIAKRMKGRNLSKEHCENISKALLGNQYGKVNKGRKLPENHKTNIAKALKEFFRRKRENSNQKVFQWRQLS